MSGSRQPFLAVAAAVMLIAAESMGQSWTLGPFVKYQGNPVLGAALTSFLCPIRNTQVQFERRDVMNPAAIARNGKVYIFYRCEDTVGPTSRIGTAQSDDGLTFTRSSAPAVYPQNDAYQTYEWPGGCEDPRIVEDSAGTYYLTYTAYNGSTTKLCVATSTDLAAWQKHGPVFRTALGGKYLNFRSKSSSILTKLANGRLITAKVNGHYWMYWGESPVFLAYSDNCIDWTPVENANGTLDTMISPRQGYWDNLFTEAGPPVVLTNQGILFLYNAANGQAAWPDLPAPAFAPGQMLFDSNDPTTVLARATNYFMKPDQSYEINGLTRNCIFIEGLVFFNNRWLLYYGAADTKIAVAACSTLVTAAFSLCSPSNNDTIRLKTPYFHWETSSGANHYEIWIDNAKRGEVIADAATPTQTFFDSLGLMPGLHTWYVNAVDAGNTVTKSTDTFAFTLLTHPDLPYWGIGPFQKYGQNPVCAPQGSGSGWESKNVLNPGVVVDGSGTFQIVYRAQDQTNNYSQIGYAHGRDGVTFMRYPYPVIRNNGTGESHGCEDPRLVKLGATYYCYYASYDGSTVAICVATSTDLINWTKYGPKLNSTKNGCIVINADGTPALINGRYWMYHGDQGFTANTMRLVSSTDLINWTDAGAVRLRLDGMQWEPCIAIADASPNNDDIVVFFAGKLWGDTWFNPSNPLWYYYAISEVVFPKSNMLERIDKLDGMIMLPGKAYETNGQFNLCIFTNSVMKYRHTWWNHYGAGDSRVAVALAPERDKNMLGPNRAKGKTATASSSVQAAANAVDSSCATRWESAASDNQWIMVDLGAAFDVRRVILKWEVAYGKSYSIQVSSDALSWTTVYATTTSNGDFDDIVLPSAGRGRYVRMLATQRGTTYGYSLWEFEVYGTVPVSTVARAMGARSGNALSAHAAGITCSLVRAQTVTLTVYSAQGKMIARLTRSGQAGTNTITDWGAFNRLPAGTYCVALGFRGQPSIIARMVKMR